MNYLSHKSALTFTGLTSPGLHLLAAGTLLFSQLAFSDATVVYEQISGSQKASNTMQIKEGMIRFIPPNQDNNYSLYDSKTGALTHVDAGQKKYLKMDEKAITEQANKVKQQMDKMRQQMQDKIKAMPPEQKKQAEKMMNERLPQVEGNDTPQQIEQKKTSRTETFVGIQCTVHESYVNGTKVNELCMTDADKLGLSTEDAEALMSMQKFMKRLQNVAKNMMNSNTPTTDVQGIPLHTLLFGPDGSVKLETYLSSISTDSISSDKISVPADFSAIQMPGTQ